MTRKLRIIPRKSPSLAGSRRKAKDCRDGEEAQTRSQINTQLPDPEQSRSAVLNSLPSISSQRSHDHAIREFIE
jgi:hypothetical protein